MLPGTPQSLFSMEPATRNGLSLARNGYPLSGASIPGSKVLTCYFAACRLVSPPGPPSAPLPPLVCPTWWQLLRFRPVAASLAGSLSCFLCLHSPPGLLPPSGSKRSTDSAASRLAFRIRPISSRSPLPFLFLGWLRITVPGSLRVRRLAVPQTSWNLLQYAPNRLFRQWLSGAQSHDFLNIYLVCF